MIKEPTVKYKRKTSLLGWITKGKSTYAFGYNDTTAKADPAIKDMPGKQNKHRGRKPGSYKHKRDIIRNSRRKNR